MNFASELKAEILRISKKSGKAETADLKAASSRYRSDIAEMKRRLKIIESAIARLNKKVGTAKVVNDMQPTEKSRFRADGFVTLRKKLGLSAQDMGKLLGVSGQSVYKWEQGKAKPQGRQLPAIVALRKMGKKGAQAKLEEL